MIDPFKTTGILGAKHFETDNNIGTSMFAENNRLRAENERLREALEDMIDLAEAANVMDDPAYNAARKALGDTDN